MKPLLDRLPHAVQMESSGVRSARRPNSSNVLPLGVAVKAKSSGSGCFPREYDLVQPVLPVRSASGLPRFRARIASLAAVSPVGWNRFVTIRRIASRDRPPGSLASSPPRSRSPRLSAAACRAGAARTGISAAS